MRNLLYIFLISFILAFNATAQSPSSIKLRCPTPFSAYGSVTVTAGGDIAHWPCPGFASVFYRTVDFSNATVTGLPFTVSPLTTKGDLWGFSTINARVPVGANGFVLTADNTVPLGLKWAALPAAGVTGTGTTNFIPLWTNGAGGVIGDTPFSWDGTTYNNNTGVGIFSAGDTAGAGNNTKLTIDDSLLRVTLGQGASGLQSIGAGTSTTTIGDWLSNGNITTFTIDDITQNAIIRAALLYPFSPGITNLGTQNNPFSSLVIGNGIATSTTLQTVATANRTTIFPDANGTVLLDDGIFTGITTFTLFRTITAGGTTGAQTINKPAGTVNFAAGASALTVTNSTVTASSIINVTARTNDATCYVKNSVPGAGSFVINMVAACTAETSVGFIVTN